jgi:hypothetical protein
MADAPPALSPGEAAVAAMCVRSTLDDFANRDPACPLFVYAKPARTRPFRGQLDDRATQILAAGAYAALEKLVTLAGGES